MEARIEINPRAGAGGEQGWVRVHERQLAGVKITQRADRNEWSYGIANFGDAKFRLADPKGEWGPPSMPNSRFALGGMEGSRVRVRMPISRGSNQYVTIWRGELTSKLSGNERKVGESVLEGAGRNISILNDAVVGGGNIQAGFGVDEILNAIFQVQAVADRVRSINTTGLMRIPLVDLVVEDEAALLGEDRRVKDILESILKPLDGMVSFLPNSGIVAVFTRGVNPGLLHVQTIDRAIDVLKASAGSERVHNQAVIETGLEDEDEEITVTDQVSVDRYGLKDYDLDLSWLRSREASVQVGRYINQRIGVPRQSITIVTDAWAIDPRNVFVGNHVELAVHERSSGAGWGDAVYNDLRYRRGRLPTITGRFYIEEIEWMLANDTLKLTLREVR